MLLLLNSIDPEVLTFGSVLIMSAGISASLTTRELSVMRSYVSIYLSLSFLSKRRDAL